MRLIAMPLDATLFAPFGTVTAHPLATATTIVASVGPAENLRPGRAMARVAWFASPASAWPLVAKVMERHRLSSQSFIPCGEAPWLVLVAPDDLSGRPDMARAHAFVAGGGHAVTFRPDVWHHPLTSFAPASFAVATFLAGDAEDEEFRPLPHAVTIVPG